MQLTSMVSTSLNRVKFQKFHLHNPSSHDEFLFSINPFCILHIAKQKITHTNINLGIINLGILTNSQFDVDHNSYLLALMQLDSPLESKVQPPKYKASSLKHQSYTKSPSYLDWIRCKQPLKMALIKLALIYSFVRILRIYFVYIFFSLLCVST